MTGPKEVALRHRVMAALQTAQEAGRVGKLPEEIAAAIDAQVSDDRQIIILPNITSWLRAEDPVAPSLRTLLALATLAGYDDAMTKQFVFGSRANQYALTAEDYDMYVSRKEHL
jgi:hypothetical protein